MADDTVGSIASRSPSPEEGIGDESMDSLLHAYVEDGTGSGRDSSGPDEGVFDSGAEDEGPHSSPDTSHHEEDDLEDEDVSELPPDSRRTSCDPAAILPSSPPMTPQKQQRSPFRHPSSVRAMQLDTTPPHLLSSSRQHLRSRMSAASRNSTPRSTRSLRSGTGPATRKEYPLVLLHVNLLPVACPYSAAVMQDVLAPSTVANWSLLQEKVSDTILERGILIPHPREDYDLLEERLLESLELKMPRILKCGHFHLTPEEEAEVAAPEDEYDSDADLDVCHDCGRRVRDARFGAGSGNMRWSIKVYASNGLMRAGAWGAAWQEMERVDVEVLPWLDEQMRRELDLRAADERAAAAAHDAALHSSPPPFMDEQRRKEIYGDDHHHEQAYPSPHFASDVPRKELPLTDLLGTYLRHLLQDRRNVAIALLSLVVLLLAVRAGSPGQPAHLQPILPHEFAVEVEPSRSVAASSVLEAVETPKSVPTSAVPEVAPVATPSSPAAKIRAENIDVVRVDAAAAEAVDEETAETEELEL